MNKKFYPFSCGSQYMDWHASNCCRCNKYIHEPESIDQLCEIDRALSEALFGDGSVSKDIAQRMGYLDNKSKFIWMCSEVDWTDEWIKEFSSRQEAQQL